MKKILIGLAVAAAVIIATIVILTQDKPDSGADKALVLVDGKFAFCGASGAELTGRTIVVQGKTFLEGKSICPVMDGISIANTMLVGNPSVTPDSTDKTVWSYFWYFDSVPQAPTWDLLPTVNRSFVVTKTQGMSNMFCMPCKVLEDKVNGVTLAECFGPINEAAVPLRRSLRVVEGETSITQAPEGASYPVGTIIPVNK
jgi:hypothetical protein